ncbi:hypothetical protein SCMU_13490 [Sinomonas cyclohexanicum]|uniref:Uncharacterized protein n=1 Tax=Sinomonas cyclohexanicum TaxID=322009 RepID=A0ABN6FHG6_SINCY|nr:hypothetical protein SCMU_13490 [Corynebacterium cyclohexanicum]
MAPRNRREGVPLAAHRVRLGGLREELALEEVRELEVRGRRRARAFRERDRDVVGEVSAVVGRALAGPAEFRIRGELGEEASALGAVLAALADHGADLPGGGDLAVRGGRAQGRDVALDRGGHVGSAAGDVGPLLGRIGGHEVECCADVLGGGVDVVQLRGDPAALVALHLEA